MKDLASTLAIDAPELEAFRQVLPPAPNEPDVDWLAAGAPAQASGGGPLPGPAKTLALDGAALEAFQASVSGAAAAPIAPAPIAPAPIAPPDAPLDPGLNATMALDAPAFPPTTGDADPGARTVMFDDVPTIAPAPTAPNVSVESKVILNVAAAPGGGPLADAAARGYAGPAAAPPPANRYGRNEIPTVPPPKRSSGLKVMLAVGVPIVVAGVALAVFFVTRSPAEPSTPAPSPSTGATAATAAPARSSDDAPEERPAASTSAATTDSTASATTSESAAASDSAVPSASAAASESAAQSASATTTGMRLEIVQAIPGMIALVDGQRADIRDGAIELTGAPGDVRVVVLQLRSKRKAWTVTIGPSGPDPAKIGPLPTY